METEIKASKVKLSKDLIDAVSELSDEVETAVKETFELFKKKESELKNVDKERCLYSLSRTVDRPVRIVGVVPCTVRLVVHGVDGEDGVVPQGHPDLLCNSNVQHGNSLACTYDHNVITKGDKQCSGVWSSYSI